MTRGGSRPKRRPDDRRGGARPRSGPNVRRLQLSAASARKLKALRLYHVTGNPDLQPVDVVSELIRIAYDEMLQRQERRRHD